VNGVISESLFRTEPWDQNRRKEKSARKSLRALALTLLVIITLVTVYLLFVSSRLWVVNLGYRISRTLEEQRELIEVNRKLRIERATLMAPERIDSLAREKLDMRESQQNEVRFVP